MIISAAATALTATVMLIFSFTDNLTSINEKYHTSYPNVPSWIFQIEGNDTSTATADYLQSKHRRLVKSPSPTPNTFSLVEVMPGRITDYNEVSPIILELIENMNYNDYPSTNPPTNTENFKPGEFREWILRRV